MVLMMSAILLTQLLISPIDDTASLTPGRPFRDVAGTHGELVGLAGVVGVLLDGAGDLLERGGGLLEGGGLLLRP